MLKFKHLFLILLTNYKQCAKLVMQCFFGGIEMRYSLAKIAEELNLSKATISMVLNGKAKQGRIGKEVEEKVLEFCRKVNYVPNIHIIQNSQPEDYLLNISFITKEHGLSFPSSQKCY